MEPGAMERFAVNEMTTYRWSFEEDVQNYAAAGIDAIGVWRQKLSDYGEEKGIELLRESGLAVSSLLWAGGFTGSEGRSYKESVEDATDAVRLAAALKAGCLILYTGARAGHTHNHARRLARSAINELAPLANQHNVTLAIEPMHPGCAADWTFLTDLDETLELLDSVDSASLKLAFDTYHLAHDASVLDRLAEIVPRIGIVQLGDARQPPQGEQNRCALGEGEIPLRETLAVLTGAGYEGYFEVELLGEEFEMADYGDLLTNARQTLVDLLGASNAP